MLNIKLWIYLNFYKYNYKNETVKRNYFIF